MGTVGVFQGRKRGVFYTLIKLTMELFLLFFFRILQTKEDLGKLDNSDNGFLMKGRSTRTKALSDHSQYPSSGSSGMNTVVKKVPISNTFASSKIGNAPPPIPPNKPALNLYKSSASALPQYSSVKTVTTSSSLSSSSTSTDGTQK